MIHKVHTLINFYRSSPSGETSGSPAFAAGAQPAQGSPYGQPQPALDRHQQSAQYAPIAVQPSAYTGAAEPGISGVIF
jgi:hypothetical protein